MGDEFGTFGNIIPYMCLPRVDNNIYVDKDVINLKKQRLTCDKNRKKRKKK